MKIKDNTTKPGISLVDTKVGKVYRDGAGDLLYVVEVDAGPGKDSRQGVVYLTGATPHTFFEPTTYKGAAVYTVWPVTSATLVID